MKGKYFFKAIPRWIPTVIIISISWYLSSREHVEHMPSFWNADKAVHFFCFGGLCFWISFACRTKTISRIWIPVFITSFYGFIDEIHQSFVPGRSCSVFDWIADTSGAIFGAVLFVFMAAKLSKAKK
ncbi:VanZ family protein [Treponema sp.]|uniref:VanZ family protein n=1 Tax=Treponema sp. TaxID=166 RepID=UPI002A8090FB|nr:VanZ family protein [Treponema sp.]MCI6441919.1 VanZ family protein [Spirochaetia bacterium]MDY4133012.1 VanZ family protein [Treponema sp.]